MPVTITADTVDFVTLAEVKAHANISSSDHDAELLIIRSAAQDQVESLIGPILWRQVVDTSHGRDSTLLRTLPVISIASVSGTTWTNDTYPSDLRLGAVTGLPTYGSTSITYTAGRTECPDAVRLATLIIARHLWETQLGNSPTRGALPDETVSEGPLGTGYAIPSRALDLLRPYMLPGGIA